ncbi:sulfite exporter TauE/SafE family protein [Aneurinibacillus sp. Ricciae_BoGa-3]|uniref:sulfite exporter TauE/SafE family protein n=1 Tax=Aneurinibacillus sp. Ricciae_BoGa-3 TaxID=3022697 RepID=UPI0023417D1F|nr:sulfite exporter TauE/SafE family protein [Aneurinibacillus sp. Ricciae_BoGa-3]WCK53897.1 sulfite exporter TauE/SafE family protein [Aneurinibacillus sp. Ricciae_BoGa-3]
MTLIENIVSLLIGLVGSFFSGLLGIGGGIINYPLLLYVPHLFRLTGYTPHEVSSISMFQVFFASLAGVLAFRKQKQSGSSLVHKKLVLVMGGSILFGSLFGGWVSALLPSFVINIIYGTVAIVAAILMLIPNCGSEGDTEINTIPFDKWVASVSAFLVGMISGIVGAGGAFILIPIMLTVLKIPTRVTIASSLAIVFISAAAGIVGKLTADHIPIWATLYAVVGSLIGAPIGSYLSRRISAKGLRVALAVLIALTALKIWTDLLG